MGKYCADIRKIGEDGVEPEGVWVRGLEYIEKRYRKWVQCLYEQIEDKEDIDFYANYLIGKMGLEWLLVLCDQVLECINYKEDFIARLINQFEEAFDYAEKTVNKLKEKVSFPKERDIFKDYAILYHIAIAEDENRIMYNLLESLYNLTLSDTRKTYLEITPEMDNNKYMRTALFAERGKRYDRKKLEAKLKFADEFCEALNGAMHCNYTTSQAIAQCH